MTIYLDGKYISPDDRLVHDLTPGARPLYGIFETMRADKGRVSDMDAHLRRMASGLKALKLKNPLSQARWKAIVRQLLNKNPYAHARVRTLVWREGKSLRHAAMVIEYQPPSQQQYRKGIKVMTVKTDRVASSRHTHVKSLDYTLFAKAQQKAAVRGYDQALLVNRKGHVFETSRANIFIVRDGMLLTPPLGSGCLAGTMRAKVMAAAAKQNMVMREQNLTVKDICASDGAFVTNALLRVMPLGSVDGRALKFSHIRLALLQ